MGLNPASVMKGAGMGLLGQALVKLVVDPQGLKTGLKTAEGDFNKSTERMMQTAVRWRNSLALVFAAGVGAVTFFGQLGIDAQETENLVKVSFGNMADAAERWAERSTAAMIQPQLEVERQAAILYKVLKAMQLTDDAAFEMSTTLVDLAADFESLYNLNTGEAFTAVRSAILGELEPLKALGLKLDETSIKTEALNAGLMRTGEELTSTARAQAILNVLMRDPALDDVGRTINETANSLRALKARLIEAAQGIGQALVPAIDILIDIVTPAVTWFNELDEGQRKVIASALLATTILSGMTVVGIQVVMWLHQARAAIIALQALNWATTIRGWGAALQWFAGPGGPVGIAIAALAALVIALKAAAQAQREWSMAFAGTESGMPNSGTVRTEEGPQSVGDLANDTAQGGYDGAWLARLWDGLTAGGREEEATMQRAALEHARRANPKYRERSGSQSIDSAAFKEQWARDNRDEIIKLNEARAGQSSRGSHRESVRSQLEAATGLQ